MSDLPCDVSNSATAARINSLELASTLAAFNAELLANPSLSVPHKPLGSAAETAMPESITLRERFAGAHPAECVKRSLTGLKKVSTILDAKAPDDAAAFKAWLCTISQKVAAASVEGAFLGFGGQRVSDAEKATLADIAKSLGPTA